MNEMDQAQVEKILEENILKPKGLVISRQVTSRRGSNLLKVSKDGSLFSLKFAVNGISTGPYDQYQLLQKEALTLKSLNSYFGHVLVDSGESNGIAWNLMKWLDIPSAVSVAEKLKKESNEEKFKTGFVDLFSSIASKVAELHKLGYIHRDLQPDHFLYDGEKCWLLDNTLCSRIDDKEFNYKGALIHYSAPEVAKALSLSQENIPYGVLSEVYSMGSVLFFLYTDVTSSQYGSTDYKNIKLETIIEAISRGPASFENVGAQPFPELESILKKMMAIAPKDRYQNMQQAAKSLHALRERL